MGAGDYKRKNDVFPNLNTHGSFRLKLKKKMRFYFDNFECHIERLRMPIGRYNT